MSEASKKIVDQKCDPRTLLNPISTLRFPANRSQHQRSCHESGGLQWEIGVNFLSFSRGCRCGAPCSELCSPRGETWGNVYFNFLHATAKSRECISQQNYFASEEHHYRKPAHDECSRGFFSTGRSPLASTSCLHTVYMKATYRQQASQESALRLKSCSNCTIKESTHSAIVMPNMKQL